MMDDGRGDERTGRRPHDGRPAGGGRHDRRFDDGSLADKPRRTFRDAARHFEETPPSLDDEWDEWLEPGAGAQRGEPGRSHAPGPEAPTRAAERRRPGSFSSRING